MSSPEAKTKGLLNEWMVLARYNRRVHDESTGYFRNWADASMISSIVLGSTSSLLNVVLGAINPAHLVIVKMSQIILGLVGLSASVDHVIVAGGLTIRE
jgi:hypothetical protein